MAGHPEFYELLDQMRETHDRKNADYAGDVDPFKNFRLCESIGIDVADGVLVRMCDKWSRITTLVEKEHRGQGAQVLDESIEDTLMDLAVYSLIAIILRRERKFGPRVTVPKDVPLGINQNGDVVFGPSNALKPVAGLTHQQPRWKGDRSED